MFHRTILSYMGVFVLACIGVEPTTTLAENLDCLIEPHEVVKLSSPVEGVLQKVYVDRGAIVKKGQIVAQMEANLEQATVSLARARSELDAAIKSGEARLAFSATKAARSEKLYEKNYISLADLQEAQTEKQLSKMALLNAIDNQRLAALELERANVALSRNTIRSPITGVVVERFLSAGEYVSGLRNDAPILKIAQIDPLRVEVFAPLALRNKIVVGAPAKLLIEAPINSAHHVRVSVIDRVVDSASGTFRVRLALPNPDNRIPAGLKCKIDFFPAGQAAR